MPAFLVLRPQNERGGVCLPFFIPTVALHRVTDITPDLLHELAAEALLLDVDNTLALHGSQTPFPGTVEWTRKIRQAGFKIMILSNNFSGRVKPFAAQYGLPYLSMAMKPLPAGYLHAADRLQIRREKVVVVGDQIFTDILGANLSKMKSILLVPAEEEDSISFRVRRRLEQPIRRKIERRF